MYATTRDEGMQQYMRNPRLRIYSTTQRMRACNNNNVRNPSLHPLILGYAYYCCMPSSPVLLVCRAKKFCLWHELEKRNL